MMGDRKFEEIAGSSRGMYIPSTADIQRYMNSRPHCQLASIDMSTIQQEGVKQT